MKQTLFLLLGYPGSGKSTFSKQLAQARKMPRINGDELRRFMFEDVQQIHSPANNPAVFGALDYLTEQLLEAGRSVIYDANFNRFQVRAKAKQLATKYAAQTVVLWVTTPLEIARQRDADRASDADYLPIPPELYEDNVAAFETPRPEEKMVTIDGLQAFGDQLKAFDTQLAALE